MEYASLALGNGRSCYQSVLLSGIVKNVQIHNIIVSHDSCLMKRNVC